MPLKDGKVGIGIVERASPQSSIPPLTRGAPTPGSWPCVRTGQARPRSSRRVRHREDVFRLPRHVARSRCGLGQHLRAQFPSLRSGHGLLRGWKAGRLRETLATTVEHAREMVEAFEKRGLKLIYLKTGTSPRAGRGKADHRRGRHRTHPLHPRQRVAQRLPFAVRADPGYAGGALLHLGCHPAAFVSHLTGQEVVER